MSIVTLKKKSHATHFKISQNNNFNLNGTRHQRSSSLLEVHQVLIIQLIVQDLKELNHVVMVVVVVNIIKILLIRTTLVMKDLLI